MPDQMKETTAGISNLTGWLALQIEPEKLNVYLLALPPADRSAFYDRVCNAKKVISDLADGIKNFALASGEEFRGYEIRNGNPRRVWDGKEKDVANALGQAFGLDPLAFMALKSPAQVEKDAGGGMEAKTKVMKLCTTEPGALGLYAKKEK